MLNEILGTAARYQQLLTRKFGLIGGAPSPQLTPEIGPSYDIESQPEDRVLAADVMCTAHANEGATGGAWSYVQLVNPTGSGIIVVLERIAAYSQSGATEFIGCIRLAITGGTAAAVGAACARDTRKAPIVTSLYSSRPSARVETGNSNPIVAVSNLFRAPGSATVVWVYQEPIVLSEGWCVVVYNQTVSAALGVSLSWREVPVSLAERGPF